MSDDQWTLTCRVNGEDRELVVDSRRTLAEVLREDLALTGTHLACEHGVCGACTISVNGAAARSCLMLAIQADGCEIETVESLGTEDHLHPIQQAMRDAHAFQCAFCAPGFLMTVYCLLKEDPTPTSDRIRDELSGNLCRCTGYASILAGVDAAVAAAGRDHDA